MCYVVTVIGGWRWRLFEPWWNAFVFPTAQQRFCWVSISGVGSGASKLHAPENWSLLEPCWNFAGKSPEHCWNLVRTPLGKHCWNLAGTLLALCWNPWETGETLLESCWKVAEVLLQPCWSPERTLLEPCWNLVNPCWNVVWPCWKPRWNPVAGTLLLEPLAGTFALEPMRASILFFFLHCFLLCLLCRVVMLEVWLDFLLEPGCNLAGTYVRIISGLVFLLWQAKKTTIPCWILLWLSERFLQDFLQGL